MPISFACKCGRKLRTRDGTEGRSATCPSCGSEVVVPGLEDPVELPLTLADPEPDWESAAPAPPEPLGEPTPEREPEPHTFRKPLWPRGERTEGGKGETPPTGGEAKFLRGALYMLAALSVLLILLSPVGSANNDARSYQEVAALEYLGNHAKAREEV